MSDSQLLEDEAKYCSYGDTVHYVNPPNIFESCKGSYMYDAKGTAFLDLQMWYSAVNFGYGNERLNNVLKHQIDTLPQLVPFCAVASAKDLTDRGDHLHFNTESQKKLAQRYLDAFTQLEGSGGSASPQ